MGDYGEEKKKVVKKMRMTQMKWKRRKVGKKERTFGEKKTRGGVKEG